VETLRFAKCIFSEVDRSKSQLINQSSRRSKSCPLSCTDTNSVSTMASILTGSSLCFSRRCTQAFTSIYCHISAPIAERHPSSTVNQRPSTRPFIPLKSQTATRPLSQSPFEQPSIYEAEFEKLRMRRIKSIRMHPDSTGKDILPGNYVIKVNERTGVERKVILEHEMGYFWALKV
jgi:hypothetical protein